MSPESQRPLEIPKAPHLSEQLSFSPEMIAAFVESHPEWQEVIRGIMVQLAAVDARKQSEYMSLFSGTNLQSV